MIIYIGSIIIISNIFSDKIIIFSIVLAIDLIYLCLYITPNYKMNIS